jgi:tetratricopeptide (TPR) repeat protein
MCRIVLIICLIAFLSGSCSQPGAAEESRSNSLQSLISNAQYAQVRGDFGAAADFYRKAVAIDPSIPQLWANLGLMCHEMGKVSDAVQSFKHALQLDPSLFVPQLFLGIEYLAVRDPNSAIPHLEKAEKLNPSDPQAPIALGKAYAMLGLSSRASDFYRKGIALQPANGEAWLGLGTAYLQQVEDDARTMVSTYGHSAYVKLRGAETLAEQGNLTLAERSYREAIASRPDLLCVHAEYGIALLRSKKVSEAEAQFHQETQSPMPCGLGALGLAVAAIAQGDQKGGLDELTAIAKADAGFVRNNLALFQGALSPDQVSTLAALASRRQENRAASVDLASIITTAMDGHGTSPATSVSGTQTTQAAEASPPEDAGHLFATGQYARCSQTLTPAIQSLTSARKRLLVVCSYYAGDFQTTSGVAAGMETNAATRLEGMYWEGKADEELAVAALTRARELEPDSPRMHILIGDVYRQKRRWSEAESEYREAIHLAPQSRAARLSLAIVLFTELKTDEALSIDKALLDEIPTDPEANFLAADIFVQKHEFQQAEPYLARCQKLNVDLLPRYHVLLGQIYAATDRVAAAIPEYKQGLTADHDGSIHYQLARLYEKLGDKNDADKQIQASKEIRDRWDQQAHVDLGQSP